MTNYVSNRIYIFDKPEKTQRIIQDFWKERETYSGFDFGNIVSIPEDLPKDLSEDWLIYHWGTNRQPHLCWWMIFDNYAIVSFETAYAGVSPFVKEMSYKYKSEVFYRFSGEGDFWGFYYSGEEIQISVEYEGFNKEEKDFANFYSFMDSWKIEMINVRNLDKPIIYGCDSLIKQDFPNFPDMLKSIYDDLVELPEDNNKTPDDNSEDW